MKLLDYLISLYIYLSGERGKVTVKLEFESLYNSFKFFCDYCDKSDLHVFVFLIRM